MACEIQIRSTSECDLCTAQTVTAEEEKTLIDRRYRYRCCLYLRFLSSQSAHKAYSSLMTKRNMYYEDLKQQVQSVLGLSYVDDSLSLFGG